MLEILKLCLPGSKRPTRVLLHSTNTNTNANANIFTPVRSKTQDRRARNWGTCLAEGWRVWRVGRPGFCGTVLCLGCASWEMGAAASFSSRRHPFTQKHTPSIEQCHRNPGSPRARRANLLPNTPPNSSPGGRAGGREMIPPAKINTNTNTNANTHQLLLVLIRRLILI